jgi:hypothetical protein
MQQSNSILWIARSDDNNDHIFTVISQEKQQHWVMLVVLVMSSSISILVLYCSCVSFIALNRNVNEFIYFFCDVIFAFILVLPCM